LSVIMIMMMMMMRCLFYLILSNLLLHTSICLWTQSKVNITAACLVFFSSYLKTI